MEAQEAREGLRTIGWEAKDLVRLTGGHWSEAWAFDRDGERFVARFGRHREDYEKDRIAAGVTSPALPIPEVLALETVGDRHVCVSRWLPGVPIESLDADGWREALPSFRDVLDAVASLDLAIWGEHLAKDRAWGESLLEVDQENDRVFGWHDKMAASPVGDATYQKTLRWLRERVGDLPDLDAVIHNDLLHANVLVHEGRVSAVLDWANAFRGDPLHDLAAITFFAPYYPAMADLDWGVERSLRLECCWAHVGLDGMAYASFVEDWDSLAWHARRTEELLR